MSRALEIVFEKGPTRRYRSVLTRADGVRVELDGGAYNKVGGAAGEVPHDISHLVVEEELRLERGVWGVLAAGGLFRGATILDGRQRPHAAKRAAEVLAESVEPLNQAEVLVRAVCDFAVEGRLDLVALRAHAGARYWPEDDATITREGLQRCFARLQDEGARWAALPAGGTRTLSWPVR